MPTDPEQLAPCPFASCGTPDVKVGLFGFEHWRVFCRRCGCRGPGSRTASGAIAEWNGRDTAAAHRAGRVEMAQEAAEVCTRAELWWANASGACKWRKANAAMVIREAILTLAEEAEHG